MHKFYFMVAALLIAFTSLFVKGVETTNDCKAVVISNSKKIIELEKKINQQEMMIDNLINRW